MPSFSGRRVPFDQAFFTKPPFGGSVGPNIFDQREFSSRGRGSPSGDPADGGSLGGSRVSRPQKSRGPTIQEITSDDDAEKDEEDDTQMEESPTKRVRSDSLPYVKEPDEEVEGEAFFAA